MKKYLLSIAACVCATVIIAQPKQRELGIRLYSLNNFEAIYKKESKPNRFVRFRSGLFGIDYSNSGNPSYARLGLAVGVEKRKAIGENFFFAHGFEPGANVYFPYVNASGFSLGLTCSYVLGFHYKLKENFVFGLELNPQLYLNYDPVGDNYTTGLYFGSNTAALSALYRFSK